MFYCLAEGVKIGETFMQALIGLAVVFAVLAVLIVVLQLFQRLFRLKFLNKNAAASQKSVSAPGTAAADSGASDELTAVISAAIAAYLADENADGDVGEPPFTLKNIR
ncbi:MAG: OadG family protein [Clostridiales bacterium]|jgi:sodium pump decarboxylase gamma subunit|nr:OadG family protein [Clostridiales bacterium]